MAACSTNGVLADSANPTDEDSRLTNGVLADPAKTTEVDASSTD